MPHIAGHLPQQGFQPPPLQQGTLAGNQVLVPGGQLQQQSFGQPQPVQQQPRPFTNAQGQQFSQTQQANLSSVPNPNLGTGFGQQAPLLQNEQGPVVDVFANQLGRNPDQAGLDFYRQRLAAGAPIEQIRAEIAASPEAQQRGQVANIPTGLSGSEQALQGGLTAQLDVLNRFGQGALTALGGAQDESTALLNRARGDVNQQFGQAVQGFQPFQQGGTSAFNQQAALSGALGPEAQQQAFADFTASPGQEFLQEQGQRQIASAVGRRGFSGDTIREAARFGQGLAQQDFGNQFNRLGQLSSQGLQATSNIGQLRGQQGSLLSNQGQFGAGQAFNFGQAGANQLTNLGINQANVLGTTAANVARGREAFGQNLGTALGTGASNVSGLQERGGAGASDILGGAAVNAANIAQNFGNLSAADQQQLAVILANLQTQQGTQLAGQPSPAQLIQSGGIAGDVANLAAGAGTAIAAFSDSRLKTNIKSIGRLGKHNYYSWTWNAKANDIGLSGNSAGVIAQEVMAINPDAVIDNGGYLMVNYGAL